MSATCRCSRWTPETLEAAIRLVARAEALYLDCERRGNDAPWDNYRVSEHRADQAVAALFADEGTERAGVSLPTHFVQAEPVPPLPDTTVTSTSAPPSDFRRDLESLVNQYSRENKSDTPDFLLADYVMGCLEAFEHTTRARDAWHGFKPFGKDAAAAPPSVSGERPAEPVVVQFPPDLVDLIPCQKCGATASPETIAALRAENDRLKQNINNAHDDGYADGLRDGAAADINALRDVLDEIEGIIPQPQGSYQTIVERASLLRHQRDYLSENDRLAVAELDRLRAEVATLRAERDEASDRERRLNVMLSRTRAERSAILLAVTQQLAAAVGRGEAYTYQSASLPGGAITSRRGDLLDLKRAVESAIDAASRSGSAGGTDAE